MGKKKQAKALKDHVVTVQDVLDAYHAETVPVEEKKPPKRRKRRR